jgi:hypothetical protein
VTVYCPWRFAYGEAAKYSHFGSEEIPARSDLVFHFEVLECEDSLTTLRKALKKRKIKMPKMYKAIEDGD